MLLVFPSFKFLRKGAGFLNCAAAAFDVGGCFDLVVGIGRLFAVVVEEFCGGGGNFLVGAPPADPPSGDGGGNFGLAVPVPVPDDGV